MRLAALVVGSGLVVMAGAAAGCKQDNPLPDGERVLGERDLVITFFWKSRVLAYTRLAQSGAPDRQDLWLRDLDQPEPKLALPDLHWSSPSRWPAVIVGDLLVTVSPDEYLAYDLGRGTTATMPFPDSAELVTIRRDGQELAGFRPHGLFVGPLGAPLEVAGLDARALDYLGADLVVLGRREGEQADAIFRVSRSDGALTQLVALAAGPSPTQLEDQIFLSCGSMSSPSCRLFRTLGCTDDTPACPETGQPPCALLFVRESVDPETMATHLAPSAYDFTTGTEISLGGRLDDSAGFYSSPDRRSVAWHDTSTDGANTVAVWDGCAPTPVRCSLDNPAAGEYSLSAAWRPDSQMLAWSLRSSTAPPGQLGLMTRDGACNYPSGAEAASAAFFSPSSDRLLWLDYAGGMASLWVADGVGGLGRVVATGNIGGGRFSSDGRFLIVQRWGEQIALSVVDLTQAQPVEQSITDSAWTGALDSNRLLSITGWNTQDLSGHLELVDLPTGARTRMGEAVTDFTLSGSVDGAATLVYAVHTRFPSPSDGLWMTKLPDATKTGP